MLHLINPPGEDASRVSWEQCKLGIHASPVYLTMYVDLTGTIQKTMYKVIKT